MRRGCAWPPCDRGARRAAPRLVPAAGAEGDRGFQWELPRTSGSRDRADLEPVQGPVKRRVLTFSRTCSGSARLLPSGLGLRVSGDAA